MKWYKHPDGTVHCYPHHTQIPEGVEFLLTPEFKQIWRKTKTK